MVQKTIKLKLVTGNNSNMQNSLVMFTFSIFDQKYFVGQIWSNRLKLSVKTEVWYIHWFDYAEFNGGVHFSWFTMEIPFWGKFVPENQNCQFKLKFGTKTNWNMQNSVVLFTFSAFDWKYCFGENFILEAEVWYLDILNMKNS